MNAYLLKVPVAVTAAICALQAPITFGQSTNPNSAGAVERGRYLVRITGCNDCHTPGYIQSGGKVPERQWLVGDQLGWQGPWGTTYPTNLRLYMQDLSQEQWIKTAKTFQPRPPMPWFNLHDMTEQDLGAIYQFIRHLRPAGSPAPAYLPPDKKPSGPVVQFPSQ